MTTSFFAADDERLDKFELRLNLGDCSAATSSSLISKVGDVTKDCDEGGASGPRANEADNLPSLP